MEGLDSFYVLLTVLFKCHIAISTCFLEGIGTVSIYDIIREHMVVSHSVYLHISYPYAEFSGGCSQFVTCTSTSRDCLLFTDLIRKIVNILRKNVAYT